MLLLRNFIISTERRMSFSSLLVCICLSVPTSVCLSVCLVSLSSPCLSVQRKNVWTDFQGNSHITQETTWKILRLFPGESVSVSNEKNRINGFSLNFQYRSAMTQHNLEHFGDVMVNPSNTWFIFLFSASVFVSNMSENRANEFSLYFHNIRHDTRNNRLGCITPD